MDYELYKEYVAETVTNSYPRYVREILAKVLEDRGIVVKPKQEAEEDNNITIEEMLFKSIEEHKEAVKYIEEWEFIRPYKHAVLFSYSELNAESLKAITLSATAISYVQDISVFDYLQSIEEESVASPKFETPTFQESDEKFYLKFNLKYKGFMPGTSTQTKLKYPVLVVIHKNMPILEVRFDRINAYYNNEKNFYQDKIKLAINWLEINLGVRLCNFDLQPILDYVDRSKLTDLVVSAKRMNLKNGGMVTLERSKDYVLPLLGELKQLMEEHEDEFSKSPVIKQLLIDFIKDTEETADLPWISLCWRNKTKAQEIVVKFQHNYYNQEYTLLQYMGLLKDIRRMDYVTSELVRLKKELAEQQAID